MCVHVHTSNHTHHVELLLKLLVGVVDAELLKVVLLKHLEAIDIQNSDEGGMGGRGGGGRES